jgi:hypothetical protein
MADNTLRYGFRPWKPKFGDNFQVLRMPLASAYRPTLTIGAGSVYVPLRAGDVVKYLNDGTCSIAAGTESDTPDTVMYGVVAGFEPLFDGTKMVPSNYYPSAGVTYGSNIERESRVLIIPVESAYFEVCADDAVTATTYAAHLLLGGQNCRHVYSLSGASTPDTGTLLDISDHNTTSTFLWRMLFVNPLDVNNADFSGKYINWIVEANVTQTPATNQTGI